MKPTQGRRRTAAFQVAKHTLFFGASCQKNLGRLERVLSGFALSGLEPIQRTPLTVAAYSRQKDYRSELFDWERKWFEADLPKPPAKILVGGAGTGAEVRHLVNCGYDVVAFEPVHGFVEKARRQNPKTQAVLCGSYEDLVDPRKESARHFRDQLVQHAPFDAVLFGWGSFTHVAQAHHRLLLLKKTKELCPDGPALLSFWMHQGEESSQHNGRAFRIGWRLGRIVKGRTWADPEDNPGDTVRFHTGFAHSFSLEELEELARLSGYKPDHEFTEGRSGSYPHTTMSPIRPR